MQGSQPIGARPLFLVKSGVKSKPTVFWICHGCQQLQFLFILVLIGWLQGSNCFKVRRCKAIELQNRSCKFKHDRSNCFFFFNFFWANITSFVILDKTIFLVIPYPFFLLGNSLQTVRSLFNKIVEVMLKNQKVCLANHAAKFAYWYNLLIRRTSRVKICLKNALSQE